MISWLVVVWPVGLMLALNTLGRLRLVSAKHLEMKSDYSHMSPATHLRQSFKANHYLNNLFPVDQMASCDSEEKKNFYSAYQSVQNVEMRARELVRNASEFHSAKVEVIGHSAEGRNLTIVSIGNSFKPLVFVMCNIHGREWMTLMFCSLLVEILLHKETHQLLNKFAFSILLSANPDGLEYSQLTERQWRKTRSGGGARTSLCVGVDLNRNFNSSFSPSSLFCSQTFGGISAFSEIEARAIRDFARSHSKRLFLAADVHSYGGYWMYPFASGGNAKLLKDHDKYLLENCSAYAINTMNSNLQKHAKKWRYGSVNSVLYKASGTAMDWFYEKLNVLSLTIELRGDTFFPQADRILPFTAEAFVGLESFLNCSSVFHC